jgi:uncharacterized membrane protein
MWAVARRMFGGGGQGRIAAGFAALWATLSPMYIYYAQEARMYTLLVLLGLVCAYCLWRAVLSEGRSAPEGRDRGRPAWRT